MPSEKERLDRLCEELAGGSEAKLETGQIGMMGEKRLHMLGKRLACPHSDCHEVRVGQYHADVLCDGEITEVQTASWYPLQKKLRYYLEQTDYRVTLLCPVVAKRRLIRLDAQTGEVMRCRLSPKRVRAWQMLAEAYWIGDLLEHERFRVRILYLAADEYRYSERLERGRKAGRYEKEVFPRELLAEETWQGRDSLIPLVEMLPEEFDRKTFGTVSGLTGQIAWRALTLLCRLGFLDAKKEGKAYRYRRTLT